VTQYELAATPASEATSSPVDFTFPLVFLLVALVIGSFSFMWSIRRAESSVE